MTPRLIIHTSICLQLHGIARNRHQKVVSRIQLTQQQQKLLYVSSNGRDHHVGTKRWNWARVEMCEYRKWIKRTSIKSALKVMCGSWLYIYLYILVCFNNDKAKKKTSPIKGWMVFVCVWLKNDVLLGKKWNTNKSGTHHSSVYIYTNSHNPRKVICISSACNDFDSNVRQRKRETKTRNEIKRVNRTGSPFLSVCVFVYVYEHM